MTTEPKTNEEIEAGIIEILKSHGLPVSTAATSQAREHAKRVAGFYRSVARKLDALTADATPSTERAEGFWWVRVVGRAEWVAAEVERRYERMDMLQVRCPGVAEPVLVHDVVEWDEYIGKGPR